MRRERIILLHKPLPNKFQLNTDNNNPSTPILSNSNQNNNFWAIGILNLEKNIIFQKFFTSQVFDGQWKMFFADSIFSRNKNFFDRAETEFWREKISRQ